MQDLSRGQLLVTGTDDPVFNTVVNVLSPLGFDIHRAPWDDYLRDHLQSTPFDVVIAGFTLSSEALEGFIEAMRTPGSACRHSGLILIAPNRHLDRAQQYIGRGANGILGDRTVSSQLQGAVSDLLGVAPRVLVTTSARIKIYGAGKSVQSFCQTQNLSSTGVLVRGFGHYAQGSKIDFQIQLPEDKAPIRGSGTISRRARRESENFDGMGIKFTSFQGADQHRLNEFLATQQ